MLNNNTTLNNTIHVSSIDLLHHAQDIGYDWNFVRDIEEFQEMFPHDTSVISFISDDVYGMQGQGMPIEWLAHFRSRDLSNILYSFIRKNNLLHSKWHFGG